MFSPTASPSDLYANNVTGVLNVQGALQGHADPLTRIVITSMSNHASRHELVLWASMLHDHDEPHFFALATDDAVLSTCVWFSIPCARERSAASAMSTETGEIRYSQQQGSQHYVSGRIKLALVVEVLLLNFSVLYTDLDVLWVRHPLRAPHGLVAGSGPQAAKHALADDWDIQIMVNAVPSTKWGPHPGIECHDRRGSVRYTPARGYTCVTELNGGFFFAKKG